MGKGRGKGRAEKSVGEGKEGRGEKGKGCTDENTGRERGEIASWVQEDRRPCLTESIFYVTQTTSGGLLYNLIANFPYRS